MVDCVSDSAAALHIEALTHANHNHPIKLQKLHTEWKSIQRPGTWRACFTAYLKRRELRVVYLQSAKLTTKVNSSPVTGL